MNNIYKEGYTVTEEIIDLYNALGNIEIPESEEYLNIIAKIKNLVQKESDKYNALSLEEVDYYIFQIAINNFGNVGLKENRYFDKLVQRKMAIENNTIINNSSFINTIINSKIIIDTIKLVDQKIDSLQNTSNDIDDKFIAKINFYHNSTKYSYLASNEWLEKLSLEYNYNIKAIPNNIDLIDNNIIELYSNTFIQNIAEGIEYLSELSTSDPVLNTYLAILELSRIEILLSYINNQKALKKLVTTINQKYNTTENDAAIKAKDLIKKRKEDLKQNKF